MKDIISAVVKYISDMINVIANHGIWKVLEVIIITMMLTMALNPEIILKIAEKQKTELSKEGI